MLVSRRQPTSGGAPPLAENPVRYELNEQSKRAVKRSSWDRKHFDLPNGYEPIDKPGLAALIQSMGSVSD